MMDVVITRIDHETAQVRRLELRREDGRPLPAFAAGAHIDLFLPNGLIRQYSLLNPLGDGATYEIGVLAEPQSRGGSRWIHSEASQGARLLISSPRNLFSLAPGARRHLLFAGGIGITPILAMARSLKAGAADFEIYYSARSLEQAAFRRDLEDLNLGNSLSWLTSGRETNAAAIEEALRVHVQTDQLYACGPASYIERVFAAARKAGWADNQLHSEAFSAAVPGPSTDEATFKITLKRSGQSIEVPPGITVAKALAGHGIAIPVSCEQGICGTCLTTVVAGIPEHRDQYLTEEERAANNQFTPCCSRSLTSELVLDI